jgi:hypothetical protein
MERREDKNTTELCVLCGEEVDVMDASAGARVKGRTLCRQCANRLGGVYDPDREVWSREPKIPESLEPRQD